MNPYFDVVDRIRLRSDRFECCRVLTPPGRTREVRGRALEPGKLEAVIWGLSHDSPVVRRCCLEILDIHPSPDAVSMIVRLLEDPVPRVRWHAVHALACDGCKAGRSNMSSEALSQLRVVAERDQNERVRTYAASELARIQESAN